MNCVVVLGPTAVGKTAIGVALARMRNGEIISADSRQVYRGLDIGSGKDKAAYGTGVNAVPYYLVDIADVRDEYTVFDFQRDCYAAFSAISARKKLPVIVGGTGLYLDACLRAYDFVPVPEDPAFRAACAHKTLAELGAELLAEKPDYHMRSNLGKRDRVVRALEIVRFMKSPAADELRARLPPRPDIQPIVLGTTLPRTVLRERIRKRLAARFDEGLIAEVQQLHDGGVCWERLEALGLEYRFVAEFLQGKIATEAVLKERLGIAIGQFAKRQETWFRGMERKGIAITWLPESDSIDERVFHAAAVIDAAMR
ncbi:MAG: tRNA (adenosine(37)-N6)-dimethylallyltransferase MiaA [Treponema sp.]|nr:tRNA (adenosine(37)-N6)-dimethylallyltransferase MiaA [Treponema sp.]